MFQPHSCSFQNSSVSWDNDVYNGVEFADAIPVPKCHITPMKAQEILSRFAREETKGFLLLAPLGTGIADYALITWNGGKYRATELKEHADGLATDHIEMFLEKQRA